MATEFEEHGDALLMHLEETSNAGVAGFLTGRGVGEDESIELLAYLAEQGWVRDNTTQGEVDCDLTGRGHVRAQQLIGGRPAQRLAGAAGADAGLAEHLSRHR